MIKQGLELKLQRNILAKYKNEEEQVIFDLIEKRKDFEKRISLCKERYSKTVAKDFEVKRTFVFSNDYNLSKSVFLR